LGKKCGKKKSVWRCERFSISDTGGKGSIKRCQKEAPIREKKRSPRCGILGGKKKDQNPLSGDKKTSRAGEGNGKGGYGMKYCRGGGDK